MVIYSHEASSNRGTQIKAKRISPYCAARGITGSSGSKYSDSSYRTDTGAARAADSKAGIGHPGAEQGAASECRETQTRRVGLAA